MKVLDHGFVELVDSMGTDLSVVNAARVSFNKRKETFDNSDAKLLNYLARNNHTSPFRHATLQFHCKVPMFVRNQWYKHVVGAGYVDHGWNEISRRYVTTGLEFYNPMPSQWRKQDKNKKQGGAEKFSDLDGLHLTQRADWITKTVACVYKDLVNAGASNEQARMVLPQSLYTEFFWTVSLQALAHFLELRLAPDSQWELRQYAKAVMLLAKKDFPESIQALLGTEDPSE